MFHLKFQGDWPWKKDLTGRCSCEIGYYFDENSGSCTSNGVPEDELYYNYVTNGVPEYELEYNPMNKYSDEDSKSFINYTVSINIILRFLVI